MKTKRTKPLRANRDLSSLGRLFLGLIVAGGALTPLVTLSAKAQKLGDLRGIDHASFNHDASHVVVSPREGDGGIWDLNSGNPVSGEIGEGAGGYLMSGDAKMVLIGFKEGHRVFDATTAKAISPVLDLPQMPEMFSPAGDLVLLLQDKQAVVFDIRAGKLVATIPIEAGPNAFGPNEDTRGSAAFAAKGAQCFIMDGQGKVTVYDTKDWKPMGKPMLHPAADFAYDFAFTVSEDGKWLATFDSPGENGPKAQLQVWDAVARKPLGKPLIARNGHAAHFVSGNRIAIIPCRGADAHLRELPSMKTLSSFTSHDDLDGMSLDVSPDQKWILTWGEDGRLDLYDATTGAIKSRCSPRFANVKKVMMAPDSSGCFVLVDNTAFPDEKHHDYYIIKVSVPELKVTETLRILESVSSASLSPDGKRIMVQQGEAEQDRLFFLDAATLKPLK